MEKICVRCKELRRENRYPSYGNYDYCMTCFNDEELVNYIQSDITKEMKEIKPEEKVKLIKDILKDHHNKKIESLKKLVEKYYITPKEIKKACDHEDKRRRREIREKNRID